MSDSTTITGIILSAGLSGRMNAFKPLLKLNNGKSFLLSIVDKLSQVCDEVIVITGFRSEAIEEELKLANYTKNIRTVKNHQFREEMFTSLQTGLQSANALWYLYHFIDQPNLPISFYKNFTKQIDKQINWIQPTLKDRKGHPILFDNHVKGLILESNDGSSLREVSQSPSIKKKLWECNYEMIFQDVDTMEDYKSMTDLQ